MALKKRNVILISMIIGFVLPVSVGAYVYFKFLAHSSLLEPKIESSITEEAWSKLELGLTKEDVLNLLGEPAVRGEDGLLRLDNGTVQKIYVFWEYNFSESVSLSRREPSKDSYIVYFDKFGLVSGFRAPLR